MSDLALILDTSIHGAGAGLFSFTEGSLRDCELSAGVADSARLLPTMVNDLLKRNGTSLNAISSFIVSRGPGSFTGIRVGISYGLGMYEGLRAGSANVKLAGVSALSCLAEHYYRQRRVPVVIFLAATKTTGYWAFADAEGSVLSSADCSMMNTDVSGVLSRAEAWYTIGPWDQMSAVAQRDFSAKGIEVMDAPMAVRAAIEAIGIKAMAWTLEDWGGAAQTDAIYLRKSSVEEKAAAERL